MQPVSERRSTRRIAAFSAVTFAGLLGLVIGAIGVYAILPLSRTGQTFPEFAHALPDGGTLHSGYLLMWTFCTLLAVVTGCFISSARFLSTTVSPFSTRRVLESCLLSFGVVAGLAWIPGQLVGQSIYSRMPEAPTGSAFGLVWLVSIVGWTAFWAFIIIRILDHTRHRATAVPPRV